jgi:hypothetical protein
MAPSCRAKTVRVHVFIGDLLFYKTIFFFKVAAGMTKPMAMANKKIYKTGELMTMGAIRA